MDKKMAEGIIHGLRLLGYSRQEAIEEMDRRERDRAMKEAAEDYMMATRLHRDTTQ